MVGLLVDWVIMIEPGRKSCGRDKEANKDDVSKSDGQRKFMGYFLSFSLTTPRDYLQASIISSSRQRRHHHRINCDAGLQNDVHYAIARVSVMSCLCL